MDSLIPCCYKKWIYSIVIPLFTYHVYQKITGFLAERNKKSLKGKVVLITGASSGLGEALAHIFYKQGCKVILAARRMDQLERVEADLKAQDLLNAYEPKILQLDLQKLDEIETKAKEAAAFHGKVDILVNNGGISYRGTVLETDVKVLQNVMLTNFFGQIALTKAILPSMIENKFGDVVVVSSVQGKLGLPHRSAYAASKHAVQGFFDSLRAELDGTGVNVIVINPGYIKTNLSLNAVTSTGEKYSKMDPTTESGMDPNYVAQIIVDAIVYNHKEILLCPLLHKLVILIRTMIPDVYFKIMAAKAKRG